MEIFIQKEHSLKYVFTCRNKVIFFGIKSPFHFKSREKLYKENYLISSVRFRLKLFCKPFYEIELAENESTEKTILRLTSFFKPVFVCTYKGNHYEIIYHLGLRVSIFQNGNQIGYYEFPKYSVFGNKTIKVTTNDTIDINFICTLLLCLACGFNDDSSMISIDHGNISGERTKFDTKWKPNTELINT